MGRLNLSDVIQALKDAGLAVERGYPAGKQIHITEPVYAVNIAQMDIHEQTLTALVTVLSPAELGASACEDAALNVGAVLTRINGECVVSACRLNGRTGLFEQEVTARFSTDLKRVMLEDSELTYVVSFTYWREVTSKITSLTDAPWSFRIEEFFPTGADESDEPEEPFSIYHNLYIGLLTFSNCQWTSCKRTWTQSGVRQVREGTAESMDLT